jgi:hypothetical protein
MDQSLDAKTLAYIPTSSLTRLVFYEDRTSPGTVLPSPSPTLQFMAYDISSTPNMPDLMRRAFSNLARSPVWQQSSPRTHVTLCEGEYETHKDLDYYISPSKLGCVFSALAPLASKEVTLTINMYCVSLNSPEVQQLGAALGTSLKHLALEACHVFPSSGQQCGPTCQGCSS